MIRHLTMLTLLIGFSVAPMTAQITVNGTILWQDRNGTPHPARNAMVELWNADTKATLINASTFTKADGSYTLNGDTQGKNTSVMVRVLCRSDAAFVHPASVAQEYEFDSSVHKSLAPGTVLTINLTGNSGELNDQAFSVLEAVTYGHLYAGVLGASLNAISVNFPVDGTGACGGPVSCFNASDPSLNILLFDRWDWDVAIHEYGHYVSRTFHIDDNPGGIHYINVHLEDYYDKSKAVRLAWGEGWPTFFSISTQNALDLKTLNIPYVGDTHYTDTEDTTLDEDLASQSPDQSVGEDNELSVSRILFYLFGGISTSHGTLQISDKKIWDALTNQPVANLADSWIALAGKQAPAVAASLGSVFAEHLAAPTLLQPADGFVLGDEPAAFAWKGNGGSDSHPNNTFRLCVFDDNWNMILDSGDLSSTTYSPTKAQWDALKNAPASHLYWVVRGSNPDEPVTGPYSSYAGKLKP